MRYARIKMLILITIGIVSILLSSCNKDEDDQNGAGFPHLWRSANVTINGALNGNFELNEEGYFSYAKGDSVYFGASQKGQEIYTIFVNVDLSDVNDSAGIYPQDMVKIYFNGFEDHNYIKFMVHGNPDNTFIVQSGSIDIIILRESDFNAEIDVILKNEKDEQIQLNGHLDAFNGV